MPKRNKATNNIDNEIDINRCCTCFGTFMEDADTDRQWVCVAVTDGSTKTALILTMLLMTFAVCPLC